MTNKVEYPNNTFVNSQRIIELEYVETDGKISAIHVKWEHENGDIFDERDIAKGSDRYNAVIDYFTAQLDKEKSSESDVDVAVSEQPSA